MFRQNMKRREHLAADKVGGQKKPAPAAVSPGDDLDAMAGDEDAYREGAELPGAPDEMEPGPMDHAALASHHQKLADFHREKAGGILGPDEAAEPLEEEETPAEEAAESPLEESAEVSAGTEAPTESPEAEQLEIGTEDQTLGAPAEEGGSLRNSKGGPPAQHEGPDLKAEKLKPMSRLNALRKERK